MNATFMFKNETKGAVRYEEIDSTVTPLITAAPDLLTALKLCLGELEAYELPHDPLHPQTVAVNAARAAIAKARI